MRGGMDGWMDGTVWYGVYVGADFRVSSPRRRTRTPGVVGTTGEYGKCRSEIELTIPPSKHLPRPPIPALEPRPDINGAPLQRLTELQLRSGCGSGSRTAIHVHPQTRFCLPALLLAPLPPLLQSLENVQPVAERVD